MFFISSDEEEDIKVIGTEAMDGDFEGGGSNAKRGAGSKASGSSGTMKKKKKNIKVRMWVTTNLTVAVFFYPNHEHGRI